MSLPPVARFEQLEIRRLFSFDPAAREQEMLELLNRFRANPAAELNLLTHSSDADVNSAISFFKVNMSVLAQQWSTLSPVAPLAWSPALATSALGHSNQMLQYQLQSHQLPGELDLGARAAAAGYSNYSTVGENVFASMESAFQGHAAFAIDWGGGANGIQNPPGHRENMMSTDFREIGISIIDAPSNVTKVGPLLATQDLGSRFNMGNPYVLGVVYNDKNSDGFYEAGEGIGGATVKLTGTGGTFTSTSMTAGGYQVQVPAGTYTATAVGSALGGDVSLGSVIVGANNVKKDVLASQVKFASISHGVVSIQGTSGNDVMSLSLSATSLVVNRNGLKEKFLNSSVTAINIMLGAGNDTLAIGSGVIRVFANGELGNDKINGGDGNDTLYAGGGKDTVMGNAGDDRLTGSNSRDYLLGGEGNDFIYGKGGFDTLDGGAGIDRMFGGDGDDSLIGGSSNDRMYGEAGNDSLNGGKGSDLLDGGLGTDAASPKDPLDQLFNVEA
jgi:hypothetical protein